jgi:hypothetical protein
LAVKDSSNVPPNIWIGDSGASCHVTQSDVRMFDSVTSNKHIIVGGGTKLPVLKTGKVKVAFEGRDGMYQNVVLQEVNYVPDMGMNLFSFNRALDSGADLFSDNKTMVIQKGKKEIHFKSKIQVGSSYLLGAKAKIINDQVLVVSERKEMPLSKFHRMLGHPSVDSTLETAKKIGIKLTGKLDKCPDCVLAKIKKKNLNKISDNISKTPGERLLLDISFIKQISLGKRNIWILIEDQCTKMKWSFLLAEKAKW